MNLPARRIGNNPLRGHGCFAFAMRVSDAVYRNKAGVNILYGLTPEDILTGGCREDRFRRNRARNARVCCFSIRRQKHYRSGRQLQDKSDRYRNYSLGQRVFERILEQKNYIYSQKRKFFTNVKPFQEIPHLNIKRTNSSNEANNKEKRL